MRLISAAFALLIGIAIGGPAALAAPQILGLMASNAPVPLHCTGKDCTAIAGTFCLQHDRTIPTYGTPYSATHPEQLTLAVVTRSGEVRRLPAGDRLRFSGYDGYTTVRISLPKSLLDQIGGTAVAVEIGPGVALVPIPQVGDKDPQGDDEVTLAVGPMRIAAARYLDQPSADADAARLVTALLNALPEHYTIQDDYGRLWETAITDAAGKSAGPAALSRAQDAYRKCSNSSAQYMRGCLVYRHRELMEPDNIKFWDETTSY
ncbi:MAG TPA: hypothetical protein VE914_00280 [Candidatus Angelobacter sp.]|nr:hypothetical protein [Candidatus Angelobacter sp.]